MTGEVELSILMDGVAAARLRRDAGGALSLHYDDEYMGSRSSVPLSLSLPFSQRPHPDAPTTRWIRSLLPDNHNVLSRWYARDDVHEPTPFGLLLTRIGLDCAGAVQFCPVGEEERISERASGIEMLSPSELERHIATAAGDPNAWLPDDIEPYFSLGGFQSKIALHRVESGWGRPYGNVATTHILKPRSERGRFVAIAEHLCLSAAQRLGLNAASSSIEQHGDSTVLVVERYDRFHGAAGWSRIHQEDMCQALGIDGNRKYEHSGGPGVSHIGDLIAQHSTQPTEDLRSFAEALIYSWLVVNRDAHARNYSLLYPRDEVRLAPLYDVNSSLMFGGRGLGERNLAMRYGSSFTVFSAGSAHALPDVAQRLRLPAGEVVERAAGLAEALPDAMDAAMSDLRPDVQSTPEIEAFARRVQRRTDECMRSLEAARRHINEVR